MIVVAGRSEVVTPSGMVLGSPLAPPRFAEVLENTPARSCPATDRALHRRITEAMDESGECSDEALADVVSSQHHLDAGGIRERVIREVRAFVGNAEPHDDMTMIVLKVGTAEAAA
jgi:hypothetical protein